ncbi:MAG: DUF3370 domain-containing protein [Elainellaceae cyanobacterium]
MLLAQTTAQPRLPEPISPRSIPRQQVVRPLPDELDAVPVFNSNSPELVQSEGILLSTFPPEGMAVPSAHLDFAFRDRFDIFTHHIARGQTPDDTRTLFLGVILYNTDDRPVSVEVLQGVSYLTNEAPYLDLPAYVANPYGTVFAGPGSRTMSDMLRGVRQPNLPSTITIPPGYTHLLVNAPIPVRRLTVPTDGTLLPGRLIPTPSRRSQSSAGLDGSPTDLAALRPVSANRSLPTNGRSSLMYLSSSGPIHVASLAMFAPTGADGNERVPTLPEWQQLLLSQGLAGPRDYPPTPPDAQQFSRFFYGRVAGVAQGSQWSTTLTDDSDSSTLQIPEPGEYLSYVLSTVDHNTFGTEQIQSAPILARYPDTAYRAHGNYGVRYDLSLPLVNAGDRAQTVALSIETPVQNESSSEELNFLNPPSDRIFFRGTVRFRYTDDWNRQQTRYFHLVQRQGQMGEPLVTLRLPPRMRRMVQVEFLYPPDATPPQVLTVHTVEDRVANERTADEP